MATIPLPSGYVSLRHAGIRIESALSNQTAIATVSGKTFLRWLDPKQRHIQEEAVKAFWKANDQGQITLFGFNVRDFKPVEIPADTSRDVPFLRRPSVGSLVYLRPHDPLHPWFAARFGPALSRVALAVREVELEKLARFVRRKHRKGTTRPRGRPNFFDAVAPIVNEAIASGKWSTFETLGALTKIVYKKVRDVSPQTVGRVLDQLYKDTGDERYKRRLRASRRNANSANFG